MWASTGRACVLGSWPDDWITFENRIMHVWLTAIRPFRTESKRGLCVSDRQLSYSVLTAWCTIVQSAVLRAHVVCLSVCLSVTLVDHDHVGWKSRKLIVQTISPTSSLFVAQRSSTYSQGTWRNLGEKIFVQHLRTKRPVELSQPRVTWGGCLFTLSAHHAVIFAIAQHSCFLWKRM